MDFNMCFYIPYLIGTVNLTFRVFESKNDTPAIKIWSVTLLVYQITLNIFCKIGFSFFYSTSTYAFLNSSIRFNSSSTSSFNRDGIYGFFTVPGGTLLDIESYLSISIINSFRLSRIRPQCFHNISISHKSKLILNYSWAYRNALYCKDLKQFPWIQSDHLWKWTNFPYEIWLSYFETVKVR